MANQVLTLLLRNIHTIRHQKLNLFCNIITPIACLFFIWVVKAIVEEEITKTRFSIKLDIPIIFNVPLYSKLKYLNLTAKTTICEEWYLYEYENKSDINTKKFFEEMIESNNTIKSFCDDNPVNHTVSPYFLRPKDVQILENETDINSYLYDRAFELNYIDLETLFNETSLTHVPDGAITIKKLDKNDFSYKMQIHDLRLPFYHRGNAITLFYIYNGQKGAEKYERYPSALLGMLWGMGLFNKAYINKLFPNITIVSGLQLMPIALEDNEENIQRIINVVGTIFYPMSISLLMPLFMYNIVIEKERQLIEIMRINGLKMRNYWISYFIFNYILYLITIIFFIIFGTYVFGLNLFKDSSFLLISLTVLIWGFAQIGLAYFFQAFLSNGRTTSIIGYMIALWLTLTCACLNLALFVIPTEAPYILNILPTFAICRIFFYMASYCGYESCIGDFKNVNNELRYALGYMMLGSVIFTILGVYLHEVLPKQYGIRKNPIFCIEDEIKNCQRKNDKTDDMIIDDDNKKEKEENDDNNIKTNLIDNKNENENDENISLSDNYNPLKDKEIEKEFVNVKDIIDKGERELRKYPLVCNGLTKIYSSNLKSKDPKKKNKKSLDNFTICLKDNEIFGLLGPNGAGKTTFFSCLTGIYEPTSGSAFIRGHSIKTELERSHEFIGYCPQFDLLWEDLSVENTLLFYSRIKNKEEIRINYMVEKILQDVKLTKFRKYLVRELSGGMKRRLSLGIALIGEPPIVFLDEPTTGLDPKNKREIWDILSHCKENRCMILTTHLMDEAETLCDRIGIILKGKIRCLGSQYKLKAEYGKGFKICFNLKPYTYDTNYTKEKEEENLKKLKDIIKESSDRKIGFVFDKNKIIEQNKRNELRFQKLEKFLLGIFDKDCKLMEKHRSAAIFEIGSNVFNPELLFKKIEESKEELEISNWAISQIDLEDIFIKLTEKDL
jgi:ABC-type multidrug transport system ATPase subunit